MNMSNYKAPCARPG